MFSVKLTSIVLVGLTALSGITETLATYSGHPKVHAASEFHHARVVRLKARETTTDALSIFKDLEYTVNSTLPRICKHHIVVPL